MRKLISRTAASVAVIAWFAFVLPLIFDNKEQMKSDLQYLADWWVK